MPKRFRSLRGRPTDPRSNVVDPPEYFDFDFRAGQTVFTFPRPSTAGGFRTVVRETTEDRPRTADRPVNKHLSPAKVEDDWIGLAIGSPTHAPTGWTDHISPISPQHAFRHEGPFPSHQQASPWKKIGGIFKPRITSPKYLQTTIGRTDPGQASLNSIAAQDQAQSIGMSPSEDRNPPPPPPKETDGALNASNTSAPQIAQATLPKLEIEIPRFEMDRYSVMFSDFMGPTSTSARTVLRKSKAVPDLKMANADTDHITKPLPSPRRMTNPSLNRFQYTPFPSTTTQPIKQHHGHSVVTQANPINRTRSVSSPVSSTFPVLLNPDDSGEVKHQAQPSALPQIQFQPGMESTSQKQAATSPTGQMAELPSTRSPNPQSTDAFPPKGRWTHRRTETANSAKPKPLVTRKVATTDIHSSPEEGGMSDKDDIPWRSTESLSSSASSQTSVEEEIFFDLKPFQDSNGVRGSQYVMTKPAADAIQLARSISQKNRKRQQECGLSPEEQSYHWTPEMFADPWGMPPDIQAAEHFCMSADMQTAQPILTLSMFDEAIQEVEKLASPSDNARRNPNHNLDLALAHMQAASRSKGLAIGIPSPIVERSCEGTPITETPPTLQPPRRHIAAQARSSPTIIVSALSSTFDLPPPVPRKDSKFLRYATKSATSQPSHRTDKASSHSQVTRKPIAQNQESERRTKAYEHRETPSRRRHKQDQKSMTSKAATKPRPEVSVARSVSLTRTPSHKVFVKRQGGSDSRIVQGLRT